MRNIKVILAANIAIFAIAGIICNSAYALSDETEVAIGRQADARIRQKYGVFADKAIQRYVDHVGLKLVSVCERPDIVYHFTVLDDPQINAMAVPGGYIYITKGLLASIESEGQLAASLAHEIAHNARRHGANQIEKNTNAKALIAIAGIVAASATSADNAKYVSRGMRAVNAAYNFAERGYGRKLEGEADLKGTEYLLATGYDPDAMIQMLDVIQINERNNPRMTLDFLSTHPKTTKRIDMIRQHIRRLEGHPRYRKSVGNLYPDRYEKKVLSRLKIAKPQQINSQSYYKYYNPPK